PWWPVDVRADGRMAQEPEGAGPGHEDELRRPRQPTGTRQRDAVHAAERWRPAAAGPARGGSRGRRRTRGCPSRSDRLGPPGRATRPRGGGGGGRGSAGRGPRPPEVPDRVIKHTGRAKIPPHGGGGTTRGWWRGTFEPPLVPHHHA